MNELQTRVEVGGIGRRALLDHGLYFADQGLDTENAFGLVGRKRQGRPHPAVFPGSRNAEKRQEYPFWQSVSLCQSRDPGSGNPASDQFAFVFGRKLEAGKKLLLTTCAWYA